MRLVETFWGDRSGPEIRFENEGESERTFSPEDVQGFKRWMEALKIVVKGSGTFEPLGKVDIGRVPRGYLVSPAEEASVISASNVVGKLSRGEKVTKEEMEDFLKRIEKKREAYHDKITIKQWSDSIKSLGRYGEEAMEMAENYRKLFYFAVLEWPRFVDIHELVLD